MRKPHLLRSFGIYGNHNTPIKSIWTRSVMTRTGLTLNEAKTSIKQARRERFVVGRDISGAGPWQEKDALYAPEAK